MTLYTVNDVDFGYDGNVAVKNLNFAIDAGDYLCITGENGSGKSTVIKGLLGLIKPFRGSMKRERIKQNEIGYLPQLRKVQRDFPASVYEVVLSGRLSRLGMSPFYSWHDKRAADEYIERLHITGLRNKCYRDLSGGQQQRVLLARSLCAAVKFLALDEPAAGLDPLAQGELYRIIKTVNEEKGLTVAMVSHDIHMAVKYSNRILHLQNKQVFFGTPGEFGKSAPGKMFLEGQNGGGDD